MKALMIIMVMSGSTTFRSMSTVPFDTLEACEKAQEATRVGAEQMLGIEPNQEWYNRPGINVKVRCVKLGE